MGNMIAIEMKITSATQIKSLKIKIIGKEKIPKIWPVETPVHLEQTLNCSPL
jgi:hypothetical protein